MHAHQRLALSCLTAALLGMLVAPAYVASADAQTRQQVLHRVAEPIRALVYEAYEARQAGDTDKSLAAINKALAYEDELRRHDLLGRFSWHEKYASRARTHRARKAWDAALSDYTRVIAIDPMPEAWYERGMLHAKKGDREAALADLSEALQRVVKWSAIVHGSGAKRILDEQATLYEAQGDAVRAKHLRAVVAPAVSSFFRSPDDKVDEAARAVLSVVPNFAPAFRLRARFYKKTGRFVEAVQDARKFAQLLPTWAAAHRELAETLHAAGAYAEAATSFERAIELASPEHSLRSWIRRDYGAALAEAGRLKEALPHLEGADDRASLRARAKAHLGLGNHEKALADASAVVAAVERFRHGMPEALRLRAAVLEAMGRGAEAAVERQRADALAAEEAAREALPSARKAFAAGDFASAAKFLDIVITHTASPEALHMRALARVKTGDLDGALGDAAALRQLDPQNARVHNLLGMVYYLQKDLAKASASFQNALARMPNDIRTLRNVANMQTLLGKHDDAKATRATVRGHVLKALGAERAGQQYIQWARDLIGEGEVAFAEANLRDALLVNPKGALDQIADMAQSFLEPDTADTALAVATVALEKGPHALALYVAGTAHLMKGDVQAAQSHLSKAVSLNPKDQFALNNLGFALQRQEKWEEAAQVYERAIRVAPKFLRPHFNLATVYDRLRRPEDEIRVYGLILAVAPRASVYMDRAYMLIYEGAFDAAQKDLDVARKLEPQSARAWYLQGLLSFEQREWAPAIDAMDRAIELGWVAAKSMLSYHRGTARLMLDRNEAGVEDLRQAVRLSPRHVDGLNNLAVGLSRLGRHEEAVVFFTRAIELAPNATSLYERRAGSYDALGKDDLAVKDRAKAEALQQGGGTK